MDEEHSAGALILEKVIEVPWVYILFRHRERLFLSVDCGSVAIFSRDIELSQDEIAEYTEKGQPFVDSLAKAIAFSPRTYRDRHIQNFFKWPVKKSES